MYLFFLHSRSCGKIRRPFPDFSGNHGRRVCLTQDSHIHSKYIGSTPAAHPVYTGSPFCDIISHPSRYVAVCLCHPLSRNAVVTAKYENRPFLCRDICLSLDTRHFDYHIFQSAQSTQRFGNSIPLFPGKCHRPLIQIFSLCPIPIHPVITLCTDSALISYRFRFYLLCSPRVLCVCPDIVLLSPEILPQTVHFRKNKYEEIRHTDFG